MPQLMSLLTNVAGCKVAARGNTSNERKVVAYTAAGAHKMQF